MDMHSFEVGGSLAKGGGCDNRSQLAVGSGQLAGGGASGACLGRATLIPPVVDVVDVVDEVNGFGPAAAAGWQPYLLRVVKSDRSDSSDVLEDEEY